MKTNCVLKCMEMPVVRHICDRVTLAYKIAKKRNKLLQFGLNAIEIRVKSAAEEIFPIARRYSIPVDLLDEALCAAIDSLTSFCPLLLQPEEAVVKTVRSHIPDTTVECLKLVAIFGVVIQPAIRFCVICKTVAMGIAEHLLSIPRVLLQILAKTTCDKCEKQIFQQSPRRKLSDCYISGIRKRKLSDCNTDETDEDSDESVYKDFDKPYFYHQKPYCFYEPCYGDDPFNFSRICISLTSSDNTTDDEEEFIEVLSDNETFATTETIVAKVEPTAEDDCTN